MVNNELKNFYTNRSPINGNPDSYIKNLILDWSDYKFQTNKEWLDWVFPTKENISTGTLNLFKINKSIRMWVVGITTRILSFFSLNINFENFNDPIDQIDTLLKKDNGVIVGLYEPNNMTIVLRMLNFLNMIDMEQLSSLVFLAICDSVMKVFDLEEILVENEDYKKLIETQEFVKPYLVGIQNKRKTTINKLIKEIQVYYNEPASYWDGNTIKGLEGVLSYAKQNVKPLSDPNRKPAPDRSKWGSSDRILGDDIHGGLNSDSGETTDDFWGDSNDDDNDWRDSDEPSPLQDGCAKRLKLLSYVGNSCYMDSTLLALFAIPNKQIDKDILKKNLDLLQINPRSFKCSENREEDIQRRKNIQTELNRITESMRGLNNVKKCSMLRSLIAKCPHYSQKFQSPIPQEAYEFLAYLFNLFEVNETHTLSTTWGAKEYVKGKKPVWVKTQETENTTASPIIPINLKFPIKSSDTKGLVNYQFATTLEGWKPFGKNSGEFKAKAERKIIQSAPFIIFHLIRKIKIGRSSTFNNTVIIPSESIELGNKQILNLSAIVIHTGGIHYVAVFKCEGEWYWYNDNPSGRKYVIRKLGTYQDMLKSSPNPATNGTLHFYT